MKPVDSQHIKGEIKVLIAFLASLIIMFGHAVCAADLTLYYRFDINNNTYSYYFGLDPGNKIPGNNVWIIVMPDEQYHTRNFVATPVDDFRQFGDYCLSGAFVDDNQNTNKTFEVIFQWDQRNNIDIYEGQTYKASILKNYIRNDDPVFLYDEDIYCFTPSLGAYCFEFDESSNVKLAISSNGVDYVEYEIKDTVKTFQTTTDKFRRAYKIDFKKNHRYYIKIHGDYTDPNYFDDQHNYSFTIKEVKPVILIHGINSHPVNERDPETAFVDLRDKLSLVPEIEPTWVFDFPWTSKYGVYTDYCGGASDNGTIHHYINEKCKPFDLKPILVVHSMGGMLTLRQIEIDNSFLAKVDDIIFFSTPFCGSDDAETPTAGWFANTSVENMTRLKRGTRYIWELMESAPRAFGNHETLFFCSEKDWVVEICSANLPGILSVSGNAYKYKYDHRDIKNFEFTLEGSYEDMFEKIVDRFNH